ncbi:hypothetical protein AGMMS4952_07660 [Spirochaetia bacterium]|nr:hypothetical protein AGMMS4952_07660 [Spirochaetia bacterium]
MSLTLKDKQTTGGEPPKQTVDKKAWVQGGSQSIQALARMDWAGYWGQIYVSFGHAAPAFMGVILITAAIVVLYVHKTVI